MKMLEKIRKATDVVIEAMKWPSRVKAINRGAESFADDVEQLKIDHEMRLVDARKRLVSVGSDAEAKVIFKEIADLKLKIDDAEKIADIVAAEREFLNSEAPADDAE